MVFTSAILTAILKMLVMIIAIVLGVLAGHSLRKLLNKRKSSNDISKPSFVLVNTFNLFMTLSSLLSVNK